MIPCKLMRSILPDVEAEGLVLNVPEMRLYDFRGDEGPRVFAVAVGDAEDPTPLGEFRIGVKRMGYLPVHAPLQTTYRNLFQEKDDPQLFRMTPAPQTRALGAAGGSAGGMASARDAAGRRERMVG